MSKKSILMVAAENDALPNAKVGGIGDVVRDIPLALARQECNVHVVLPDYGYFAELSSTVETGQYLVDFGGKTETVTLYRVSPKPGWVGSESVSYWAIGHDNFSPCGIGAVYCDDPQNRPFATDATKYALFSAAVSQLIIDGAFGHLDVLHLHDWHASLVLFLKAYHPRYQALQSISTVYTIHNLSLQGVRPFKGDESSLERWYPNITYDKSLISDPRAPHCINPMRVGINLADKVHAVSPSYASEIQRESFAEEGIYGGEGLEGDLRKIASEGRLIGILNGCEYPDDAKYRRVGKVKLAHMIREELIAWVSQTTVMPSAHWVARERIQSWVMKKERGLLLTSIGRITEQKVRLFKTVVAYGDAGERSVLEHILLLLGDKGTFILLGSGDPSYELFLQQTSGRHYNFIFLNGYAHAMTEALYSSGDLFLMPSSFEPCGISQMLAMRAGQPCLVNSVGGLKDTVHHNETGFSFSGADIQEQAYNFVECFDDILSRVETEKNVLENIGKVASTVRFSWDEVASQYLAKLY